MRKNIIKFSILGAMFLPFMTFAQDKKEKKEKKEEIQVRVEKEVDGKKEVIVKKIDASKMTAQQREEAIQKMQDSLMAGNKGNQHRMKIEISDDDMAKMGDSDMEQEMIVRKSPKSNKRMKFRYYNDDKNRDFQEGNRWNGDFDLDREMGTMGNHLRRLGEDIPNMIDKQVMIFNNGGGKSTTVKGLEVFPNNPQSEILNLNFNAPEKGDVTINVLDVKGNVVAKEEVKDFTGEYVGQVNIGKAVKGTYFVMVTQNGDGIVRRVVIP